MTASSASPEFDRLLLEAIEIAGRIHGRLADGRYAPADVPDIVGYLNDHLEGDPR